MRQVKPSIQDVPVARIQRGPNDRQTFDEAALLELADSIRTNGIIHHPTLRPLPGGRLEIVAGERRIIAMRDILKWRTIPALVKRLTDEEAEAIMLAENTGRTDLNPIEQGRAFEVRAVKFGWSHERIAETAGVSVDLVKRRRALLALAADVQHLVKFGQLPVGHAEAMLELDPNRQRIALRIYSQARHGMNLAQFRVVVQDLLDEQAQDAPALFDLETFWVQQVTHDLPRRGRFAFTGAPTRADLPPVSLDARDNAAAAMDRYIAQLLEAGRSQDAATIGTLYNALVLGNLLAVPTQSILRSENHET